MSLEAHAGVVESGQQWRPYLERYEQGQWRARVFRDLIMADATQMAPPRMLDIGCGGGFDNDRSLQASLAAVCREYVGVEPDPGVTLGQYVTSAHRCLFEEAPIACESVDIAFSVMVLEHVENPEQFFEKVHEVLRPGGVFWGFTMDARHWFVAASLLADRLHIKDWYLDRLHGKRGEDRYENYGVHYRVNSPAQIESVTAQFSRRDILNFQKVGQLDFYFPASLRWIGRTIDRIGHFLSRPGSIIALRLQR